MIKKSTELMGQSMVIGVHGQPGSGKTTLAATIGDPEEMLWLQFDHGGVNSLAAKGISVDTIDVNSEMRDAKQSLSAITGKALGEAEKLFKIGKKKYLVIDTLTAFGQSRINELMEIENKSGKPNKYAPYSAIARELEGIIRISTSFAPYVVVCMHSKYHDADDSAMDTNLKNQATRGMAHIVADLPGRAALNAVFGCMSMVLYAERGSKNVGGKQVPEFKLIDDSSVVQTKSRFSGLLGSPLPFNLGEIIAKIKEGVK
jgi:hypothetical protein